MTALDAPDRRGTDSNKWRRYPDDVIPLWVADMDFAADPTILDAIRTRLDHPCLGYARATETQRAALSAALLRDHDWRVEPEWLVFLPGVEPGFNMALHAFTGPGGAAMQEVPVYHPLRSAPGHRDLDGIEVSQEIGANGRWTTDPDQLEEAARRSGAWLLCNPQNPTGRVYTKTELEHRAELCQRHDLTMISDEIHCGLTLDGRTHIPIASLDPAIAARSVTLMAASKTWNIAGMKAAFAVIPDPDRRAAFEGAKLGMVDSVNVLGLTAMTAAYDATGWREAVRVRLAGNRDLLAARLASAMPDARMVPAEAGFLAWIDFAALSLPTSPASFFLQEARVALSEGAEFGDGLDNWARLNLGCPTETLSTALDRMEAALVRLDAGQRTG